ncbi:hypothetical protein BN927_02182 [Lactococcus lactis subsp. lactis Dephy 1]|nr:hypothetical protein BN927_02182 [Lactococcus lactis subsp. lactis Dephy 1]
MDSIYLIVNKVTGEIINRVYSLKEAFQEAHGNLIIWETN